MISKFVRMLRGNPSGSPTEMSTSTVRNHSAPDPNDTYSSLQEADKAHREEAYQKARLYIHEEIASKITTPGQLTEVPTWAYDLYEILLYPPTRLEDVRAREQGYKNLIFRSTPVTPDGS